MKIYLYTGIVFLLFIVGYNIKHQDWKLYAQYKNEIGTNYFIYSKGMDWKLVATNGLEKREFPAKYRIDTQELAFLYFTVDTEEAKIFIPLDNKYRAFIENGGTHTFDLFTIKKPINSITR